VRKPRDDLARVLARLDMLKKDNEQLHDRVAALEEIIASRLGVLPPAVAESTMTPKEAAYELDVSVQRISQMVGEGKLRATRLGGRLRIDRRSLDGL
jgi:excisionase family DNA binding protein